MTITQHTPIEVKKDPLNADHLKVGLKARSIRNAGIMLLSQGGKFGLQFLATVMMARLLEPGDFGVFSIVWAITAFGLIFKDGLAIGTVQRDSLSHAESSGLFWISAALGLGLAVATIVAAPFIAMFYHQPRMVPLIVAMTSTYLFSYVSSQQMAVLRRQMRFGSIGIIDQVSMFMSVTIGIICAWRGCGVWSLVIAQIALCACACAGAWIASEWRPGPYKANSGLRALLLYGKHVAASDVATYITRNFDNLLIGWSCGVTPLGFYDRAYGLMQVPVQQLLGPLGGVAHTTLSRLQNEPDRYRIYAKNMIAVACGLGMPICTYLCIGAHRVIPCLLGEKWRGAVPILQALAPGAFIDSFLMAACFLLLSSGRTREYFQWRLFAAILGVVAFFLGVHWGPIGVAAALSLSRLAVAIVATRLCCLGSPPVSWAHMRQAASAPFWAAIASGALVACSDKLIDAVGNPIVSLLISAASFGALYLAIWALLPGGARTIADIATLRFKQKGAC